MRRSHLLLFAGLLALAAGVARIWWPELLLYTRLQSPRASALTVSMTRSTRAPAENAEQDAASRDSIETALDCESSTPGARCVGLDLAAPIAYLAVGGGALPSNTEVSLEQDLALAHDVLGAHGIVLFAGGMSARSVRELTQEPLGPSDALLVELGALFAPRAGRDSRYRKSRLQANAATREALVQRLSAQLAIADAAPLLLYIAAHGEQGEQAADNSVQLWGGESVTARELAELHDDSQRPLRVVITSCFSGGFAELAFRAADPAQGVPKAQRCGLFAGTWDRETSGCDPDPDRRKQEGYGIHLLHALVGQDRHGRPLESSRLDLDGDRRVGLLEAHTWARVTSSSIDVPTTTSERHLRQVQQRKSSQEDSELLPEDAAVVSILGARLGFRDEQVADARLVQISEDMRSLEHELEEVERMVDEAYYALASQLLARWPVLDDPYHPEFAEAIGQHRADIAPVLRESHQALRFREASESLRELDERYGRLQVQQAMLLRYLRAHETLRLAHALRMRGGPDYDRYRELLACERSAPPQ